MVIIFISVVAYYSFNTSYRLSLESRYYFEIGKFDKAYKLAKKAYILDPYNRMAFTIKTQAKIAKEWKHFINDANKYFKTIQMIANKKNITDKDKLRIKMMLEILLDEYKTLTPSLLTPEYLKKEAKIQYLKTRELYEKLFGK